MVTKETEESETPLNPKESDVVAQQESYKLESIEKYSFVHKMCDDADSNSPSYVIFKDTYKLFFSLRRVDSLDQTICQFKFMDGFYPIGSQHLNDKGESIIFVGAMGGNLDLADSRIIKITNDIATDLGTLSDFKN